MNKEFFKKFHNSLAFTMGFHSMYVPGFTFAHQMRDYGLGVMLLMVAFLFFVAYSICKQYIMKQD